MEICCGDFAFWTSWNWENPSCQSACNRGRGKLYQHNWSNLIELHKVLEENELSCMDLLHVNTDGLI
uniref:Uncharacterized protein n=1 Tax=Salix viminalis TaxID=40686 RepID=A0A6N2LMI8_SALVM